MSNMPSLNEYINDKEIKNRLSMIKNATDVVGFFNSEKDIDKDINNEANIKVFLELNCMFNVFKNLLENNPFIIEINLLYDQPHKKFDLQFRLDESDFGLNNYKVVLSSLVVENGCIIVKKDTPTRDGISLSFLEDYCNNKIGLVLFNRFNLLTDYINDNKKRYKKAFRLHEAVRPGSEAVARVSFNSKSELFVKVFYIPDISFDHILLYDTVSSIYNSYIERALMRQDIVPLEESKEMPIIGRIKL